MSFSKGGQKNTDFTSKPRSPRFTLNYFYVGKEFLVPRHPSDASFYPEKPDYAAVMEHYMNAVKMSVKDYETGR